MAGHKASQTLLKVTFNSYNDDYHSLRIIAAVKGVNVADLIRALISDYVRKSEISISLLDEEPETLVKERPTQVPAYEILYEEGMWIVINRRGVTKSFSTYRQALDSTQKTED